MSGLWDQTGVPHRGWNLVDVIDVEDAYEVCQMCGNERIRYVHIVETDVGDDSLTFRVGCICAEKMCEDLVNPRRREKRLRNRAVRRAKWTKRTWNVSADGNEWLTVDAHHIVIFQRGKNWTAAVDGRASKHSWSTRDIAKLKAFDFVWPAEESRLPTKKRAPTA